MQTRFATMAAAAFLVLALPTSAQEAELVVRGEVARVEIERVLAADNLDTVGLTAREVAGRMARIERGRAPHDFWLVYRAHLLAWQRVAQAEAANGSRPVSRQYLQAIDSTFDEVERIARRYGAHLPAPVAAAGPAG